MDTNTLISTCFAESCPEYFRQQLCRVDETSTGLSFQLHMQLL